MIPGYPSSLGKVLDGMKTDKPESKSVEKLSLSYTFTHKYYQHQVSSKII